MLTPEFVRAFCASYRDAWNRRDADALLALTHPDVVWQDPTIPHGGRAHGHAEVRAWLAGFWRAFPDMTFDPIDASRTGADPLEGAYLPSAGVRDRLCVPWRCAGHMRGPIDPPGFAPTGRALALEGVDLYDFVDDKVARVRTITDLQAAGEQLGLMPPRDGFGARLLVAAQRALVGARGLWRVLLPITFVALIAGRAAAGSDPLAAPLDYDLESCLHSSDLGTMICVVQKKTGGYRVELRDTSRRDPVTRHHVIVAQLDLSTTPDERLLGMSGMNRIQYSAFAVGPQAYVIPVTVVKGDAAAAAGPRRLVLLVVRTDDGLRVSEGWRSPGCGAGCTVDFFTTTSPPPAKERSIAVELRGNQPKKWKLRWQADRLVEAR